MERSKDTVKGFFCLSERGEGVRSVSASSSARGGGSSTTGVGSTACSGESGSGAVAGFDCNSRSSSVSSLVITSGSGFRLGVISSFSLVTTGTCSAGVVVSTCGVASVGTAETISSITGATSTHVWLVCSRSFVSSPSPSPSPSPSFQFFFTWKYRINYG